VVAEVPMNHERLTLDNFLAIMLHSPEWAEGIPVAVKGWANRRYRK
jgi:hypothetical protein